MSMLFVAVGLTPPQIEKLRERPELVSDVVYIANDEDLEAWYAEEVGALTDEQRERAAMGEKERLSSENYQRWAAELAQAHQRLAELGPLEHPLGLNKMWHILHYAIAGDRGLTGGPGDVIFSGDEIGEDMTYGPARLIDPAETAYYSRHLEGLDLSELEAGLNFDVMREAEVYSVPRGPRSAEYDAWLRKNFARSFLRLQDYLSAMSGKGNGLLMWVS